MDPDTDPGGPKTDRVVGYFKKDIFKKNWHVHRQEFYRKPK
jgi:hypothetical protein